MRRLPDYGGESGAFAAARMSEQGHKPECFVYRFAEALMGLDRTGFCDCGLHEQNVGHRLTRQEFGMMFDRMSSDQKTAAYQQILDGIRKSGKCPA